MKKLAVAFFSLDKGGVWVLVHGPVTVLQARARVLHSAVSRQSTLPPPDPARPPPHPRPVAKSLNDLNTAVVTAHSSSSRLELCVLRPEVPKERVKMAPKAAVPAVLLLLVMVLAGITINSSHLKFQFGAISRTFHESEQRRSTIRKPNVQLHNDTTPSPELMTSDHRPSTGKTGDDDEELLEGMSGDDDDEMELSQETGPKGLFTDSCFKARPDTVHASKYKTLQPPFINLGFPKMGTSSLHAFFSCGNLTSVHLDCKHKKGSCAKCFNDNVAEGRPPLTDCGGADVYAQIDNGRLFPQIDILEEIVHGHPNATFFLTMRSMDKWFHSLTHWPPRPNGPHMHTRFRKFNITGLLEVGRGKNVTGMVETSIVRLR